ncbi:hypothetical protein [Streptomyces sp. NPDC051776]|uniref:hypothetical protein n=1 Tax=Streptomyces sp. NPDC051776 TaxID=3155414 RepID=UPI00343E393B
MSHPDPNNPYGGQQQGQPYGGQPYGGQPQEQPYGYPQQQTSPPGYAYPQAHQGAPYAAYPGGVPGVPGTMPGQVVAARVLLFVAGGIWALTAVIVLIFGVTAQNMGDDFPGSEDFGDVAAGVGIVLFLLFGGLAALHIAPASMFGKGRAGTRITAIIAASLNSLVSVLAFLFAVTGNGNPAIALLWAATAIVTLVFCCLRQAGEWFNRPQY